MWPHLRFWWQRRRAGLPVKLGTKSCGITTYSQLALLRETLKPGES